MAEHDETPDDLETDARARRRLIALTVYGAPLVIGTLLIGRPAQAQGTSCLPRPCDPNPCVPPNGCNPNP